MSDGDHDLGNCCCCEKGSADGVQVRNIVMLDKKCPTPGKGWGCFVCDLPQDGAMYVTCDACLDAGAKPHLACRGFPGQDGRVPIEELGGPFEHDLAKHEVSPLFSDDGAAAQFDNSEFSQPLSVVGVRTCRVCGCTDDRACWDEATSAPCHWVEADLCSICARGEILIIDGDIVDEAQFHQAADSMIANNTSLDDCRPRILGPDGEPFST